MLGVPCSLKTTRGGKTASYASGGPIPFEPLDWASIAYSGF